MIDQFEELLHWQAEIANAIIQLQEEIINYETVENSLLRRREQDLVYHFLGLKNELKEIEYGLHYVQIQLKEKRKELSTLQNDFQKKVDAIISHYHSNQVNN